MATVGLTGGSGFLGKFLIEEMINTYEEVRVLSRNPNRIRKADNITKFQGDLTVPTNIPDSFFKDLDCLFHAAAKVGSWPKHRDKGYVQTNIEGTQYIIEESDKFNIPKIIYTSSYFALGETGQVIGDENWNVRPTFKHPYVHTKYEAGRIVSKYILENQFPIIQVYPTVVLGSGMDNPISDTFIDFINGKFPGLPGGGTKVTNFVYAKDVAKGHILAEKHGTIGEGYLLGGEILSYADLFKMMAEKLGIKQPRGLPVVAAKLYARFQEMKSSPTLTTADVEVANRNYKLDSSKADVELHYRSRNISEVVDELFADFLSRGMLNSKGSKRVNAYLGT